jgi:chemotaxis signal transduction protein
MQTLGSPQAQLQASPLATPRIAFRASRDLPALLLPQGTISQVATDSALAPVPNTQPWFRGVYGMRGTLVPVFDLAAFCGAAPIPAREAIILVLEPNRQPLGFLCTQAPTIAMTSPLGRAPVFEGWQALSSFLDSPVQFEGEAVFEFRFREWIAKAGKQLISAV